MSGLEMSRVLSALATKAVQKRMQTQKNKGKKQRDFIIVSKGIKSLPVKCNTDEIYSQGVFLS